jgi:hypothetical protein
LRSSDQAAAIATLADQVDASDVAELKVLALVDVGELGRGGDRAEL